MSAGINYGKRGGIDARKIAKQERLEGSLYERQALTDYAQKRAQIQSEAIPCSICGESVHPDNMDAHMLNRHNVETVEVLTADESARLGLCEGIIARGIKTYIEVGEALLTIRDQRLYRAEYKTFADYCLERWQFSKTHANRLIDASEVADNLTPIGVIPANESQARALVALEPDQQRIVWQALIEVTGGKLTTARVQEAVNYFKTAIATGAIEDENGNQYPIADIVRNGIEEQHYERQRRAITHRNTENKTPEFPALIVQYIGGVYMLAGFENQQQAEKAAAILMSK